MSTFLPNYKKLSNPVLGFAESVNDVQLHEKAGDNRGDNPVDITNEPVHRFNMSTDNLPVFCISSRVFQMLSGRLKREQRVEGFTHIDQTEVSHAYIISCSE